MRGKEMGYGGGSYLFVAFPSSLFFGGWLFVGAILFRILILAPFFATFYNPHSLHVCLAPPRDKKRVDDAEQV